MATGKTNSIVVSPLSVRSNFGRLLRRLEEESGSLRPAQRVNTFTRARCPLLNFSSQV